MDVLLQLLLAGIATVIIWFSSERLEEASQRLANYYGLPEIVKGSVVTAIGSSFPELSSVVIATLFHDQFELGIASIVGSAIFNVLVIPACSVLATKQAMRTNRELVYKEAQFFLIAVVVLLLSLSFAVIYHPVPGQQIQGTLTPSLAMIPVALYGVYIFIQYLDARDPDKPRERDRSIPVGNEWLALVGCMLVVGVGVELLVRAALVLGELLNSPPLLWGLTVIAAGTSLPDLFISVKASRGGASIASLSNVLGSNTFDLLIAVPAGVLLGGSVVINFSRAAPMMGVLTLSTVIAFVLMRYEFSLTKKDAIKLICLYGLFVVWMGLESMNVSDVLNVR